MSSQALYRLAGIALLAGGALTVLGILVGLYPGNPLDPAYYASVPYFLNGIFTFLGAALMVLGLPALVAAQADRSAVLTTIGVICIVGVNLIYGIANTFVDLTVFPYLITNPATRDFAQTAPPVMAVFFDVGMLLGVVGPLTLGIAVLRARVLPRWIGIVILLVIPAQVLSFMEIPIVESIGPALGAIALIGAGFTLMKFRQANVAQPAVMAAAAQL